jgi:fatty-acyl-CoA synthase
MVKSRGENVYAAEVEFVLLQHPKVREAAMIGLPDEKWGELVTAVVVLKPGEEATEQEVTDFCRGEMAHYKAPKRVIFTDAIPKSFKGEIIKRELREKYAKKV